MEGKEEQRLRRDAERVEELLDEIYDMVGPPAWQRVEELVTRLVGLYGAGLSRILEHLEQTGAMEPALEERLLGDEAVEGLLLLHGLHPEPTDQRVRRAVERVRSDLGANSRVEVEVVEIDDGGVRLRLHRNGAGGGGPVSVEAALRRAVASAAPEVLQVEIEGGGEPAQAGEGLVNIDLRRNRRRKDGS